LTLRSPCLRRAFRDGSADPRVAAALAGIVVFFALAFLALAPLLSSTAWSQVIEGDVPKQVDLVVDGDRLVASNIRFSRFDELILRGRERVRDMAVGEAVIVVVTTQRIIAYGVLSGWRSVDREPNEQIESVSASDYGGLIVTSKRLLNFNGQSGVWGEQDRRPSQ
jgi:hypothetical protein